MIVGLQFDNTELNRAMQDVINESDDTDYEIVTKNARIMLKSIVFNTPRDKGTTRAGYYPAWEALEMKSTPGTRRGYRSFKQGKRIYVPEGKVNDQRRNKKEPYFEFTNTTHYKSASGNKVYYPYILNSKKDFFGRGAEEAAFKFGREYEKLLKKHGKL